MESLDKYFNNGFFNGMFSIIVIVIIAILLNKALNKAIKRKFTENNVFYLRVKKILIILIALAFILSEIKGLSSIAKALLASGGIFAVVIGLASQEAASNLINGFMIMTYKPYKVGDYVRVHEYNVYGKVIDMTIRHSIIETLERTQVIVPNTIMNKAIIENVSNIDSTKANHLFIDVSYESDLDKAINIIQQQSEKHPLSIDGRSESDKEKGTSKVPVHVVEFKDSGISLRATVYSEDNIQGFQMLSDLRKDIKREFDKEGIVIPYPHSEVIIKKD